MQEIEITVASQARELLMNNLAEGPRAAYVGYLARKMSFASYGLIYISNPTAMKTSGSPNIVEKQVEVNYKIEPKPFPSSFHALQTHQSQKKVVDINMGKQNLL
jgi:hypothetical protein